MHKLFIYWLLVFSCAPSSRWSYPLSFIVAYKTYEANITHKNKTIQIDNGEEWKSIGKEKMLCKYSFFIKNEGKKRKKLGTLNDLTKGTFLSQTFLSPTLLGNSGISVKYLPSKGIWKINTKSVNLYEYMLHFSALFL